MKNKSKKVTRLQINATSKLPPSDLRDFLLIKDKIYYVATQSDRDRLRGYEALNKLPSKDPPATRKHIT